MAGGYEAKRLIDPLTDLSLYILQEWRLTPAQVRTLAKDLAGEYEEHYNEQAEIEDAERNDPEAIAARLDAHYRQMVQSGRM